MIITEHEKQTIALIDEQVLMLRNQGAAEDGIVMALVDLIPEVRCIIEGSNERELTEQLAKYEHFAYFVALLQHKS